MDLVALRSFVTVVEEASFSRAAERLHVAQPAVSQQVRRLERQLGAALLRRSTRRVDLTPAGERLLPRARSILADVERIALRESLSQTDGDRASAASLLDLPVPEFNDRARAHDL